MQRHASLTKRCTDVYDPHRPTTAPGNHNAFHHPHQCTAATSVSTLHRESMLDTLIMTNSTSAAVPSEASPVPPITTSPTLHDRPPPRLSLPLLPRLILTTSASFLLGASLGSYIGGHASALQFLAENAHRLPRSEKGWYFYHKTKNYRTLLGAVKAGVRTGGDVAKWVALYVVFEDAVDRLRGRVDAGASVVASLAVAGGVGVWHGFGYGMAVRAAKRGLAVGVGYGLVQDAVRGVKGDGGGVWECVGLWKRENHKERTA